MIYAKKRFCLLSLGLMLGAPCAKIARAYDGENQAPAARRDMCEKCKMSALHGAQLCSMMDGSHCHEDAMHVMQGGCDNPHCRNYLGA